MPRLRALIVCLVALPMVAAGHGDVSAEAPLADTFHGLIPARFVDTRSGGATVDDQFEATGPVGAGSTTDILIAGRGDVPAFGVGAVALNVTSVSPSTSGFVTVWPTGAARPNASNLNSQAGATTSNMVIVRLGDSGQISLYNANGSTDLLVDVLGWFPTGASFTGLVPTRLMDTRVGGATVDHQYEATGSVGSGSTTSVTITNRGGVPEDGVGAVVLNVTGVSPSANSYITVWPAGATRPNASNLNLRTGVTTPNMVIVPLGAAGQISLFNANGNTGLIVDVLGWFPTGPAYNGLVAARLADTRATGATIDDQFEAQGLLHANSEYDVQVLDRGGVPASGVGAVALNVTAVSPTQNSFITVWPAGATRPVTSNLNLRAGVTTPNMVIVPVGEDGSVTLYNESGSTDVLVDVLGWFPETEAAPSLIRVSVGPSGVEQFGGPAYAASVSGDGRYTAFESSSTNLVDDDTNLRSDIFVYDRVDQTTTRVSVNSAGEQAEGGDSVVPIISPDGRWIVYQSAATNLVADDTNGLADIFLFDRQTQTTTRVNVGPAGDEAIGGDSELASVSADGRFVTFDSPAPNLVVDDTNSRYDVFLRDTQLGVTTRVSVSSSGAQAAGDSFEPTMSDDGRFITYYSYSADLLDGADDTNGSADVFLYDRVLATTTRVSVDSSGNQVSQGGFNPDISSDGRFIVFDSRDSQLDVSFTDSNSASDIFIYDRILATTKLVSQSTLGVGSLSGQGSTYAAVSGDGRYVTYRSQSSTFDAGDTNSRIDVYVWDRFTGETTRVSLDTTGGNPNANAETVTINDDGKYIAYQSSASNLIVDDTNSLIDVFLRFMGTI